MLIPPTSFKEDILISDTMFAFGVLIKRKPLDSDFRYGLYIKGQCQNTLI